MDFWEPERVANAGAIMQAYSPFLQVGTRIRRGQEGDPCTAYRAADEAPVGTIESIEREDDGYVSFKLKMDDGEVKELDNRSVERTWEVDPAFLSTFRGIVANQLAVKSPPSQTNQEEVVTIGVKGASDIDSKPLFDEVYRGTLESRFSSFDERLTKQEALNAEFRGSVLESIRALSEDVKTGKSNFSTALVDGYSEINAFRGNKQSEKTNFEIGVTPIRYSEYRSDTNVTA